MRKARHARRFAVPALLVVLASVSPCCQQAELDLSPAKNEPAQGGNAGAAGDCEPLDRVQEACRRGALPNRAECSEQDVQGWSGCYDGGCAVCTKLLRDYPYYFDWHPCCEPNDTCGSSGPVKCNARCPAPTDTDRQRPCFIGGA